MTVWEYLRHKCECCKARVTKGQGWYSAGGFSILCDPCMKNGCCITHRLGQLSKWKPYMPPYRSASA